MTFREKISVPLTITRTVLTRQQKEERNKKTTPKPVTSDYVRSAIRKEVFRTNMKSFKKESNTNETETNEDRERTRKLKNNFERKLKFKPKPSFNFNSDLKKLENAASLSYNSIYKTLRNRYSNNQEKLKKLNNTFNNKKRKFNQEEQEVKKRRENAAKERENQARERARERMKENENQKKQNEKNKYKNEQKYTTNKKELKSKIAKSISNDYRINPSKYKKWENNYKFNRKLANTFINLYYNVTKNNIPPNTRKYKIIARKALLNSHPNKGGSPQEIIKVKSTKNFLNSIYK